MIVTKNKYFKQAKFINRTMSIEVLSVLATNMNYNTLIFYTNNKPNL